MLKQTEIFSVTFIAVKLMLWTILQFWVTFIIPLFYRKLSIRNIGSFRKKGPVVIVMNHPNAFSDPVLFCHLVFPRRPYFMARGDAFKPGFVTWFLETLHIVPVFRIQDAGKEGLKKNEDSYRRVNRLLRMEKKVTVFGEGICIQERRLRPLKKGVARMIFGAYDAENIRNLMVLPIGVNYSDPPRFRSKVFYNIGELIPVAQFQEVYQDNPARAHNLLLSTVENALRSLVTHINDPVNDKLVIQVEKLAKRAWLKNRSLDHRDLYNEFLAVQDLTEKVNRAYDQQPATVNDLRQKADAYFSRLHENKTDDRVMNPLKTQLSWRYVAANIVFLVIVAPLYLIGGALNYLPLKATYVLTKKTVKNIEFFSSFAIGFGMVIYLMYYVLLFIIGISVTDYWIAFAMLVAVGLCGWVALYYHPILVKTVQAIRMLRRPGTLASLAKEREELMQTINKF